MIVNLYTINDKVVQESGPVFQSKNDAVAIRSFMNMIRNESALAISDYQLVLLGSYDTENMTIVSTGPSIVEIPSGEVNEN